PFVLTVGATNARDTSTRLDDQIASYSSKGPTLIDHVVKPDIVAPGNRVISLLAKGSTLDLQNQAMEVAGFLPSSKIALCDVTTPGGTCQTATVGNGYFRLSGTSMATPVISG